MKGGHPVYSFVMHGRTIPEAVNWHRKYNEYGPTICDVIVLSEYEFIATFLGNYYGAIRFKAFPQGHDVRRVHKRKSKR